MSTVLEENKSYCVSLTEYKRFPTRAVRIGHLTMGGNEPIRVQSMTTTDTMDTEGSIQQSIRMIDAGCELVRITAPSKRDAQNLENIKSGLRDRGYTTPLVADIHFTPNAAEIAARIVEKVRVNPGNYADKKKFQQLEYTDESYKAELERIRERFTPLVQICKEEGTAMRIGTNHGSLSDRIMSRYGDTPLGMVESAMEFLRICRDHDYHEIVLSMKASNPQVMVQAYRLLVNHMMAEGMNYPLHLGVTEAGEGEDGRIKSAVGIGSLLEDGLGDTVRVSLTEEPEEEIPVARTLVDRYEGKTQHSDIPPIDHNPLDPFNYERRKTHHVFNFGDHEVPRVIGDLSTREEIKPSSLFGYGYNYSIPLDKWNIADQAADFIYIGDKKVNFEIPGTLGLIVDADNWSKDLGDRRFPLISLDQFTRKGELSDILNFIDAKDEELYTNGAIAALKKSKNSILVLHTNNDRAVAAMRRAFIELINRECSIPVVVARNFQAETTEQVQLYASTDAGALMLDGLGDGLWLRALNCDPQTLKRLSFGILQATRTRISKTEYISCPSCGRTLFDLQETTAKIRKRTDHLKGVKIGIMGCIVNGPGEMADADYGYVGTGPGKITLYKEKEVVRRNVPSEDAVDALIDLIKEHGDWLEPVSH